MTGGTIEPTGMRDFPPCPCCDIAPRRVWGNLHFNGATTAYVVQWSPGASPETHGAVFGLVFGPWSEGSSRDDREHVALEFRMVEGNHQFMVIDAAKSPVDCQPLAARALRRDEVLGSDRQALVFGLIEQVWTLEPRLAELRHLQ